MADEDIQPLVCDNGTGMVKVKLQYKDDSNIHNLFSEEVICKVFFRLFRSRI
jgi:hypothetical protein